MAVNSFGHKQMVTVTYMETPSRFFVQMDSAASTQADVESELQRAEEDWANLKPIEPDVGDLVLAPSQDDLSIYRARVVSEFECTEHEEIEKQYKCHFIDEGHSHWVPGNYLRKMPVDLKQWAPLAHECCLHRAVPMPPDDIWSDKACSAFFKKINDHNCMLVVYENVGSVLSVDLNVNERFSSRSMLEYLKSKGLAGIL